MKNSNVILFRYYSGANMMTLKLWNKDLITFKNFIEMK